MHLAPSKSKLFPKNPNNTPPFSKKSNPVNRPCLQKILRNKNRIPKNCCKPKPSTTLLPT